LKGTPMKVRGKLLLGGKQVAENVMIEWTT
jgi:hypothetical protein